MQLLSRVCDVWPASVAQMDTCQTGGHQIAGFIHAGSGNILLWSDNYIFSMVILSFLLIQEWQLSVSGERMCTSTD